jgi:hypothetical protein
MFGNSSNRSRSDKERQDRIEKACNANRSDKNPCMKASFVSVQQNFIRYINTGCHRKCVLRSPQCIPLASSGTWLVNQDDVKCKHSPRVISIFWRQKVAPAQWRIDSVILLAELIYAPSFVFCIRPTFTCTWWWIDKARGILFTFELLVLVILWIISCVLPVPRCARPWTYYWDNTSMARHCKLE